VKIFGGFEGKEVPAMSIGEAIEERIGPASFDPP
jgi:hypothetical protein